MITAVYATTHTAYKTTAAGLRDGRQLWWPVKDQ